MFRPLRPLLRLAGSTAKPLPSAFPRYLTSKSAAFRPSKPAYLTRQTSSLDPTLSSSFWLQVANKHITWSTSPTTALEISPDSTHSWFPDGALNMSANCLDRHLSTRSSQPALVYHSSVGSTNTTYTYSELHTAVSKFAQCLLDLNVKPGDTVLLYMPMIPSAIIAMLACSRIGAGEEGRRGEEGASGSRAARRKHKVQRSSERICNSAARNERTRTAFSFVHTCMAHICTSSRVCPPLFTPP